MKKVVPFKKDITLDTVVASINSISLEHNLEKKESNLISGEFIISGTYKMTPSSINLDNFEYKLPVNITIDNKYDTENVIVDINDFYYEVINDQILSINIEVLIDNLEERSVIDMENKQEEVKEVSNAQEENLERETLKEEVETVSKQQNESLEENNETQKETEDNRNIEVNSIFSNMDCNDNYVVYKIHVLTENDTIESIMEEYQTNREILEEYNDLGNIKIGDKIIIANNGN